jgi:phage terminase Nu1 subunit (DNA packaging protein)
MPPRKPTRKPKPPAVKLATRAEAVAALGLPSPRALDKLVEKGAPRPAPGRKGSARYDVEAIKAWRQARQEKNQPTLDLTMERALLARAQRRLAVLRTRKLRGELVLREAADAALSTMQAGARAAILRLPTDALQRGVPREHEALLRELCEGVLNSLASKRWAA